jgi:hypothetical protein
MRERFLPQVRRHRLSAAAIVFVLLLFIPPTRTASAQSGGPQTQVDAVLATLKSLGINPTVEPDSGMTNLSWQSSQVLTTPGESQDHLSIGMYSAEADAARFMKSRVDSFSSQYSRQPDLDLGLAEKAAVFAFPAGYLANRQDYVPTGGARGEFLCGGNIDVYLLNYQVASTGYDTPAKADAAAKDLAQKAKNAVTASASRLVGALNASGAGCGGLKPLAIGQFNAGGNYEGGAGIIITRPISQNVSVVVGEPTQDGGVQGVGGVTVKLFYDGLLVSTQQTNAAGGFASFGTDWLPKDITKGRSQHQMKVQASKDGYAPAEATKQIEVQNGLEQTKILVKPVDGTYKANQTVTIEGKVFVASALRGSNPVPAKVTVSPAFFSAGSHAALGQTATQADGSFSVAVQLPKPALPVLVLQVQAAATQPDQFEDASTEVTIAMEKGKQLVVTLGTDKGVYQAGDTVAVQGTVTSEGDPVSANVQVVVDGVSQGLQPTASDGTFSAAFVPPTLPGQLPAPGGQHLAIAVAQSTGYDDGAATAYFLVGGEALDCVPLPFDVLIVKGLPTASSLIPPNTVPPLLPPGGGKGAPISFPKASPSRKVAS